MAHITWGEITFKTLESGKVQARAWVKHEDRPGGTYRRAQGATRGVAKRKLLEVLNAERDESPVEIPAPAHAPPRPRLLTPPLCASCALCIWTDSTKWRTTSRRSMRTSALSGTS